MTAPARTLYTPDILGAATALAGFAWDDGLPLKGDARSRRCGSTLMLGLSVDAAGRIDGLGLRAHACAIGQAAAYAFANAARGRSRTEIAAARGALAAWLAGEGPMPDWPGIALVEPALGYPGRHDAILLAWDAALAALG
ncbi:iron-sulfur cluster assembly scaffold protein [Novosphingobium fuchskuhlense]|uniref:iron-sulfur cluster assembly scaffold protein n=1 Tax=Novosphingobium fuchskuhlense TaxID=1117702 RepID=UPI000B27E64D|nr:iron-sulfur cluster assembly scaffold protein [Novosphingobium fuchskuhlense]